jgi:hypothetical protein
MILPFLFVSFGNRQLQNYLLLSVVGVVRNPLSNPSFLEHSKPKFARGLKISARYLQFWQSSCIGKLYVTNSDFSSDIGRLCVIILHLFFPSVKPLPTITESIELRFFLENPFAESPPSLCNNPSVL